MWTPTVYVLEDDVNHPKDVYVFWSLRGAKKAAQKLEPGIEWHPFSDPNVWYSDRIIITRYAVR